MHGSNFTDSDHQYCHLFTNKGPCGSVLRIDKGSRAASHVSRYSIGTINSTVTIYIPYER